MPATSPRALASVKRLTRASSVTAWRARRATTSGVVVVKRIAVDACHEQIGIAVVIVIAHRRAAIEARAAQSRVFGDILEYAAAIVAKQPIAVLRIVLLQRGQIGSVGEEDVGTSVAIVIEHRQTSGHRGGHMPRDDLAMLEVESDGLELEPYRGHRSARRAHRPIRGCRQQQQQTHQAAFQAEPFRRRSPRVISVADRWRNRKATIHINQNIARAQAAVPAGSSPNSDYNRDYESHTRAHSPEE